MGGVGMRSLTTPIRYCYPYLGSAPILEDFLATPIFEDALAILKAPTGWCEVTHPAILQLFNDPPKQRVQAIMAITRFQAIAEELAKRKMGDRPFWLPPEREVLLVSIAKAGLAELAMTTRGYS
jgi:hypothetical protein